MYKRYKEVSDGVLDAQTDLVWNRETKEDVTWQEATAYAVSLGRGWRLPTKEELESVLDSSKMGPATKCPGFKSNWYWSSSSVGGYIFAWSVYFYSGFVGYYTKDNSFATRCVRDA